jgi:hypothetical protein
MSKADNPFESPTYVPPDAPAYPAEVLPPMSGMAVASLVLGIINALLGTGGFFAGIVGFCCCAGLPAFVVVPVTIMLGIVGGVLGYFGMQECKTTGKRGHGLALAGLITSAVGFGFGAILALMMLGLFALAASNQS